MEFPYFNYEHRRYGPIQDAQMLNERVQTAVPINAELFSKILLWVVSSTTTGRESCPAENLLEFEIEFALESLVTSIVDTSVIAIQQCEVILHKSEGYSTERSF